MLVKEVMTKQVISVLNKMTFFETAKLFLKHGISGAPVVNEKGELVGVLSEKDLFRALYPTHKDFYTNPRTYIIGDGLENTAKEAKNKTIEEISSKRLITTTPETNVLKIGGSMVATGIHRVPVVDEKKLVGMVSRGDIYRAVLKRTYDLSILDEQYAS
ncbi:MAG: CBS domain-containing protein [Candidatus Magasanikbacteria bacterium]|nr:CBS domain-containing protein [Candidatus Magasanikbacteria bacterium]